MDREKQIEEIDELTTVLYEANHKKSVLDYRWLATEAYNVGYRKQSEVAKEIFEEIEKLAFRLLNDADYTMGDIVYDITELKNKYTGEK